MKKHALLYTTLILAALAFNINLIHGLPAGLMDWLNTPVGAKAEISGKDGALTVTTPNTIINKYCVLVANAPVGASMIAVTNPGGPNGLAPGTLTPGDLILIIQMAGATINTSDSPNYGAVTNLNSAGRHEFVTVSSVEGNLIKINPPCGGLMFGYSAAGKTQIVRVPQYTSLAINSGGSLTAPAWDGKIGGVVVAHVQNNAIINGAIDASGLGYRGGALSSSGGAGFRTDYATTEMDNGAEKAESFAGYQIDYDLNGGRYGRGAPANGGGGGTSHNSGGGGGANGNNGKAWTGQGLMDGSVPGAAAWQLDPGYAANGNALTDSSGGGRGGYSYGDTNGNALTNPPGDPIWSGDNRREVGGLGGRPAPQDTSGRIFFGGGGGAGAQNDNTGGAGGNGGGLIYIIADTVSGAGVLRSNGANGGNTHDESRDGAGGAGAGGTIVIYAKTLGGVSAQANGGHGGNHIPPAPPFTSQSVGPGAGGGGGFIAYNGGSISAQVNPDIHGISQGSSVSEFPANGATRGASGAISTTIASIPFCSTTSDISVTKTNNATTIVPGAPTTYTIVVKNNGPNNVFGIPVTDPLPPVFTNITWTCSSSPGSSCLAASGAGNLNTRVNLLNNGTATFQITATPDPSAPAGSVTNTVTIAPPAGAVDTNPDNNAASDTDTFTPQADLSITKTDGVSAVTAGTGLTYTITVRNNGPSTVSGATVTDPLSSKFGTASWTCTASAGGSCAASNGTGSINTTVNLSPGATATFIIMTSVAPAATGSLVNTATVTSPVAVPDTAPSNNSATDTDTINPSADLAITKTASPNPVNATGEVTFTINVTNNGPSTANDVTVTDPLATGLTLVSATSTQGSCSGAETITCNIGSLDAAAPNNVATITIKAKVAGNYPPGPLANTAVGGGSTSDPNNGNNSGSSTITVLKAPGAKFRPSDIAVRTTGGAVCIGGGKILNVEVKLTNTGDGNQKDNPGSEFTALLPTQLSAVTGSCSASKGTCSTGLAQIDWNGEVNAGETVTINYRVLVRQSVQAGQRFCTDFKVNYDTDNNDVNDATTTAQTCQTANCQPAPCSGPDCPDLGPGVSLPDLPSPVSSDTRPGSILIFPAYTSDASSPNSQNTRINITNVDASRPAFMHLFFVDGSSCSVADSYLCLTPVQTASFLLSDLDPGVAGYLIAVAVDSQGCPTNFNYLIGDEYIKFASGHSANLGAESVSAINVPSCSPSETNATIRLDGVQFSQLGRVVAADGLASVGDNNSTLLIVDRIGGNLGLSATTIGSLFGILYNDIEIGYSFTANLGTCQLRAPLTQNFPRTAPRYPDVVPPGRSGWMKLWIGTTSDEAALVGATINANSTIDGYRGGHNLHKLTLGSATLTIPLFPPSCQ